MCSLPVLAVSKKVVLQKEKKPVCMVYTEAVLRLIRHPLGWCKISEAHFTEKIWSSGGIQVLLFLFFFGRHSLLKIWKKGGMR